MKPETIEIKNNTNNTIRVSVENEEEQESRGDFHDFDDEPNDLSFLKSPLQIEKLEPLVYEKSKTECLLEQILKEIIQIRKKLKYINN